MNSDPSSDTPRRRGRPRSAELGNRILSAAAELFSQSGVERTTTREVAARAGTTERTLFQHFGSKDGLLGAVMEKAFLAHTVAESLASLARRFDQLDGSNGEFAAWHRQLLEARLESWKQTPQLARLLIVELMRHPQHFERFAGQWRQVVWKPLVALFERLQAAGRIRDDLPAASVARHFLAVNLSFLLVRVAVVPDTLADDADEIEAITNLFLAGASPAGDGRKA